MDNGTMFESFKYLNYVELAKSSLASKRFSNLIRTNRLRLALLYVDYIYMINRNQNPTAIKIFGKELSLEEYDELVIRNGYSKEKPVDDPVAKLRSNLGRQVYEMRADYKDPSQGRTFVFNARIEYNHENWPLFQHFTRLLTDPYIYIVNLILTPRIDVSFVNLLARAMIPNSNRLQCDTFVLSSERDNLEDSVQKFIGWTKNNVLCKEFRIFHDSDINFDDEVLDFIMTGGHCTHTISINRSDISNVIVAFLQKFMDLKECDGNKMVESIWCYGAQRAVEVLKRDYAKFNVKEEKSENHENSSAVQVLFELINNRIGRKLQITSRIILERCIYFLLDIKNL